MTHKKRASTLTGSASRDDFLRSAAVPRLSFSDSFPWVSGLLTHDIDRHRRRISPLPVYVSPSLWHDCGCDSEARTPQKWKFAPC